MLIRKTTTHSRKEEEIKLQKLQKSPETTRYALALLSYKKLHAPTWETVLHWQAGPTHNLLREAVIRLHLQIGPHEGTQNYAELLPTTSGEKTHSHDLANSSSSPQSSEQYSRPFLRTRCLLQIPGP